MTQEMERTWEDELLYSPRQVRGLLMMEGYGPTEIGAAMTRLQQLCDMTDQEVMMKAEELDYEAHVGKVIFFRDRAESGVLNDIHIKNGNARNGIFISVNSRIYELASWDVVIVKFED